MAPAAESGTNRGVSPYDDFYLVDEMVFVQRGCCYWFPLFELERSKAFRSNWWERIARPPPEKEQIWLSKVLKKMRINWKTFVRKLKKRRVRGGKSKFQYDPLSYALNFDDGAMRNGLLDDEDLAYRDFSSRYAFIPRSAKSSMDLGNGAPLACSRDLLASVLPSRDGQTMVVSE